MAKLTKKRRVFLEEYLQCWNGAEAARRAGYAHPRRQAYRLLTNDDIKDEIQRRIDEKAMSADEVLLLLADQARGDIGDFLDIGSMAFDLSLKKAKELGLTHLIKKVKQRTTYTKNDEEIHHIEIELHDPQKALQMLGKHHKLFTNVHEHSGKDGEPIPITTMIINAPEESEE